MSDYLGRPSAGDSPFAIGDRAMRDTSSPQPPSQRNPQPRAGQIGPGGFMTTPTPFGSSLVSNEARRRYEERYAKKRAEDEEKKRKEEEEERRKQQMAAGPPGAYPRSPGPAPGPQGGGGYQQAQQMAPQQYGQPPARYGSAQPPHGQAPPYQQPPQQQYQQQQSQQYAQAPPPQQRYSNPPPMQHQTSYGSAQHAPPTQHRPMSGYGSPPPMQHQQQSFQQQQQPNRYSAGPQWSSNAVPPPAQNFGPSRSPSLPQQVEDHELQQMFNQFDSSRSGALSSHDLQRLLAKDSMMDAREDCVKMLMNIFDTDKSGSINFMEFEGLYRYIQDWHGIFRRFDRDGSGLIDRKELHQALLGFGFSLPSEMVRKLEKRFAPPQQPGQPPQKGVGFDRFLMACVTVKHYTEAFRKLDPNGSGRITIDYNTYMEIVMDAPS